jgi:RNA polymerase sigma-70 factor (ECF subfamily)
MKPWERSPPSNVRVKPPREAGRSPDQGERSRDEADILERCRAGDTEAFRALVERYRDRAYGLAFRILRSAPDAEEVAQDAFVKAWVGIKEFRGDAAFSTWLHRIVARKAFDRIASLRTRSAREAPLETVDEPSVGAAAPGVDARRVARLVEMLPDAQRVTIALFYFESHSVAEIGRMLEMPEGTVKTNLARARAALRREWTRTERVEAADEV